MRILGIDPGLRRTGFGVVDADGMPALPSPAGPSWSRRRCRTPEGHPGQPAPGGAGNQPDVAALEIVFLNTNPPRPCCWAGAGRALCALADNALAVTNTPRCRSRKPWSAPTAAGAGADDVQHLLSLDGTPAPTRPTRWPAPSATRTPGRCRTSSAAWARRWAAAIPGCETAAWSAEPPALPRSAPRESRIPPRIRAAPRHLPAMIGRITGTLIEKLPPTVCVDVNGLGYDIDVPMSTLYALPNGARVTLYAPDGARGRPHPDGFATAGDAAPSATDQGQRHRRAYRAVGAVRPVGGRPGPGHHAAGIRPPDPRAGHRQENGGTPAAGNARQARRRHRRPGACTPTINRTS